MASHVPFLAVRPDEQFDTDIKTRASSSTNGMPRSSNPSRIGAMDPRDAPEAPPIGRVPPASKLPAAIRFPLVCLLSLSLSTLFYSLVADWAGVELAAVSRDLTDEWQIGALFAWKFAELSIAWYAGYDCTYKHYRRAGPRVDKMNARIDVSTGKDLASLACLSNLPYYFLLTTFYELHGFACFTALAIDVTTIGLPFALLRPLIHAHEPGRSANQQVAQDSTINFLMALFGSSIYAVVVYSSLYTWLPVHLVTHFDGVRSFQKAHDATIPLLIAVMIPVGWATAQFLFTPTIGARGNPGLTDPELKPEMVKFNPETATFGETVAFNIGFGEDGFSKRAEVLAKRTAVLIACSVTNTFVRVLTTVEGTEPVGAIGWAGVWGIAAALTSLAYAWVGNE